MTWGSVMQVEIQDVIFTNKQNIPWNDVEEYLKQYVGKCFTVKETGDIIYIGGDFPDEYTESGYTRALRGALAKVKANASTIISEIIENAENRRWMENKNEKHRKDASGGWYRYDVYFGMPVQGSQESEKRMNIYKSTVIVRIKGEKLYLYDIINIKKEASTPH